MWIIVWFPVVAALAAAAVLAHVAYFMQHLLKRCCVFVAAAVPERVVYFMLRVKLAWQQCSAQCAC